MSGTELIMGMGEVINYLKELEEQNKKLKAELEGALEELESVQPDGRCLLYEVDVLGLKLDDEREENKKLKQEKDYLKINMEMENNRLEAQNKKLKEEWEILNKFCSVEKKNNGQAVVDWICTFFTIEDKFCDLEKEHKKLKEENECVKRQIESVCKANDKLKEEIKHKNEKFEEWGEENKELKENLQQEKDGRCADLDELEAEIKKLKATCLRWQEKADFNLTDSEEESESEEEEEPSKYDGEDWARGYGFTVKDGEYRINMAGGGDHWEDYLINKHGCFIHNGLGESLVKAFIGCPEGNYMKVVHIGDPDYELEEGETDIYDMVMDSYQEEIMEYEKEEDKIPTDSDEEEPSGCRWGGVNCEINVVGVGWCQYENEEERDKKVVYCKNDCWKLRGDKTAKDEEGNYCETDEEEEVVKDINGKEVKIPTETEEWFQEKFGVSREVWIELVKKSEFE